MNVFKPVMIFNLLHSISLLKDACQMFAKYCIEPLEANRYKMDQYVKDSLMLVTALSEELGYDKCSQIANLAYDKHITLKQAALQLGVKEALFDRLVVPEKMTHPDVR